MSNATGLPLSPTFDDVDLRPLCLPAEPAQGSSPPPENSIERVMDVVFGALLPHPVPYQALCDKLRDWYRQPTPHRRE